MADDKDIPDEDGITWREWDENFGGKASAEAIAALDSRADPDLPPLMPIYCTRSFEWWNVIADSVTVLTPCVPEDARKGSTGGLSSKPDPEPA